MADPQRFVKGGVAIGVDAQAADQPTDIDPVCGMSVDPTTPLHVADYDNKLYYFCADGCRSAFLADPDNYLVEYPALAPAGHTTMQMTRRPTDQGAHQ